MTHNYHNLIIILFLAMTNSNCAPSIDTIKMDGMTVEKIINKKKRKIVKVAQELIKLDTGKDIPEIYETKVFSNDSSVIVLFDIPIKFAAKNSVFYYSASVDIISKTTIYQPIINTKNKLDAYQHFPFYIPSIEDEQLIELILNAINGIKSSYRKHWKILNDSINTLTIIEKNTFYDINILSEHQSTRFKMDKNTGEITDRTHRHIKNPPLIKIGYSEIKK